MNWAPPNNAFERPVTPLILARVRRGQHFAPSARLGALHNAGVRRQLHRFCVLLPWWCEIHTLLRDDTAAC